MPILRVFFRVFSSFRLFVIAFLVRSGPQVQGGAEGQGFESSSRPNRCAEGVYLHKQMQSLLSAYEMRRHVKDLRQQSGAP